MTYKIVPMKACHTEQLVQLERECFAHPWSEKDLQAQLQNETAFFLVAEQGERVLGYIGIYEVLESCEVANLGVFPAFRRCGIAKALAQAAMAGAVERQREFITLEVRPSNTPACNLYESLGFQVVGRRKNFYTDPTEDAILMTKYFE